ncbi:hypothetical protein EI53_01893 [Fusobacterium naviforme]|nr:hypothetical protein F7P78_06785 [Fusobacterium naviforme]PSL09109.1 hypothetical protein EI53_01893 [Fusobacterium naviforme]STO27707.1 Uncharacterised protein [Fusobacterium naviforme]
MSYGREIAAEMMIEQETAYNQHMNRLMKSLWTMEDGTIISVRDMDTGHIGNCIRMLKNREDDLADMWIRRFRDELEERHRSLNFNFTLCS